MLYLHFVSAVYGLINLRQGFGLLFKKSVMKVVVGIALQIMCSYITFPLYALVTQVERTADELLERKMGTRP
jgi:mlo protein